MINKRIVALSLTIILIFTLSACNVVQTGTSADADTPTKTTAPVETLEPVNPHKGSMRDISSAELVSEIKVGINFASALDRIDWNFQNGYLNYGNNGADKVDYVLNSLSDTVYATEEMVTPLAEAGFDAVRLTVSYSLFTNDATFEIDEAWLDKIEEFVIYILDSGMYCILDIHYDYMAEGQSWVGDRWSNGWMLPEYKDYVDARFGAIWTQVAERFKDYNDYLLFEGMNEPHMEFETYKEASIGQDYNEFIAQRVNELNAIFLDAVRGSSGNNGSRHLVLPCAMEFPEYLQYLDITDDPHVIATVHTYFNENPETWEAFTEWSSADEACTRPVDESFALISDFMQRTGIPVIIGEFGNTEALPVDDRIDNLTYVMEQAKKLGTPCFWWECGWYDWEGGSMSFSLYDREKLVWRWPEIVDAIMAIE